MSGQEDFSATLLDSFEQYRACDLADLALEYIAPTGDAECFSHCDVIGLIEDIAHRIWSHGVLPGDRVVLAPTSGRTFFIGFWACQLNGAIAVPWKVPDPQTSDADAIVRPFLDLCEPSLVLLDPDQDGTGFAEIPTLHLNFEAHRAPEVATRSRATVSPDALALLQFTSGSTSEPKGCMLTHRAILANATRIYERAQGNPGETCVHWVPLHHDMGLMGGVLAPVILKQRTVIIEPRRFMSRPLSWVNALAGRGPVHFSVSNFALAMVLKRIKRLTLESDALCDVKNIFCGAEPIDAALVRDFIDALKPFGLPADAVHPAYGMAEATLLVTSRKAGLLAQRFRECIEQEKTGANLPDKELVSGGVPPYRTSVRRYRNTGHQQICANRQCCAKGLPRRPWYINRCVALRRESHPQDHER